VAISKGKQVVGVTAGELGGKAKESQQEQWISDERVGKGAHARKEEGCGCPGMY